MNTYNDYEYRSEVRKFIEINLLPNILRDPNRGYPEFKFVEKSSSWLSDIHTNDLKEDSGRELKTELYKNTGILIDHSRETHGTNIVWWGVNHYQRKLHEELERLASEYGLTALLPRWDYQRNEDYTRRVTAREELLDETTSLLWSDDPESREVLDYLRARGWTDDEIKRGHLGYINVATRNKDKYAPIFKWEDDNGNTVTDTRVGTTHRLTIPYYSGGSLLGYKLRDIHLNDKEEKEKKAKDPTYRPRQKYINTKGLPKGASFYGIPVTTTEVVIVEGDLDALHAQLRGFPNIVGTAGDPVGERQVLDALRRGVTRFFLLFDSDERGASFVRPSISTIEKVGGGDVEVRIATIPEGEGKDLDEFLKDHTIDDLEQILQYSTLASELKYNDIRDKYVELRQSQGEVLTPLQQQNYKNEVQGVINNRNTRDRERIFQCMKDNEKVLGFEVEDSYRDYVNQQHYEYLSSIRREEVVRATESIKDSLTRGDVNSVLNIMRTTVEGVRQRDKRDEYNTKFANSSIDKMSRGARGMSKGVRTGYLFDDGDKHKVPLILNEGLTFVSANTGHGKTSFLTNVAINVAKRNLHQFCRESVLFFSYEVSQTQILVGLLNLFHNDPSIGEDPQSAILSYLRGEGSKEFYTDPSLLSDDPHKRLNEEALYRKKHNKWLKFTRDVRTFDKILRRGSIKVIETNDSVEDLVDSIKWYIKQERPALICIDYIQLMYSNRSKGKPRHEELKDIVGVLNDLAKFYHIPILLASQFNRNVDSPLDLKNSNVGESGSIERIADTSIGLFNLKELRKLQNYQEGNNGDLAKVLTSAGYDIDKDSLAPVEGKIFARLMKRRWGHYPIDTILPWEGKTKCIEPNDPDYTLDNSEGTLNVENDHTYVDPDDDPLGGETLPVSALVY